MCNSTTTDSKKCTKCGEVKPLSGYHKKGTKVDGSPRFKSACKACESAQIKEIKERGKANQRLTHLFDLPNQDHIRPSVRYAI